MAYTETYEGKTGTLKTGVKFPDFEESQTGLKVRCIQDNVSTRGTVRVKFIDYPNQSADNFQPKNIIWN